MNSVVLSGRLARDVELQQKGEFSVARFTIAVNRPKAKDGTVTADFINCEVWNKRAEVVAKYFHKGSRINVSGAIRTGSYTNKEGKKVFTTTVNVSDFDFVDGKNDAAPSSAPAAKKEDTSGFLDVPEGMDTELPFD